MPSPARRKFKLLAILLAGAALLLISGLNFSGHGWLALPNYHSFNIPGFGDAPSFYDNKLASVRQAILPFEPVGCCLGQSSINQAIPGMQRSFVGYALAPALVTKAGEVPLVLIDLDNDKQVQDLLPKLNADLVVNTHQGAALVRLRPVSPQGPRP